MQKKVSVIIPTYNRKKELIQSIKTVIDQSYSGSIEIIIIDDSEKSNKNLIDDNFPFLSKTKNRYLKYIHKAKKEGAPIARNLGIRQADGEYVAFLDDDDLWMKEKLEKQVEILEKNNDVGLVICYSLDKRFGHERINKPPESISNNLILKSFNLSSTSSYLARKKVIEEVSGFDINLPSAQEYDLAIKISEKYSIKCVQEVLMIQHSTKGQISENWNRKIKGIIALYKKHYRKYRKLGVGGNIINNLKTIGLLFLFTFGFVFGNKIYFIIIPIKKIYESV